MTGDVTGGATGGAGDPGWLSLWPARLAPMADLLCFPGAGAGASVFLPWRAGLPAFANLFAAQLPGRETRIDAPFAASLAAAAEAVAAAYLDRARRAAPLVLFGHSMGGALAVETARRLAAAGRAPAALVLSASAPPMGGGAAALDAAGLRALLIDYDPANARIVANEELFASLGPVLGADIAMLRGHRAVAHPPLTCAAELLSGAGDRVVPAAATAGWAAFFADAPAMATLPGGHHFPFRESRDAVVARVGRRLADAVAAAG